MGAGKKKKSRWAGIWTALLGALCALVLSVVFYGTMVYQLADDMQTSVQRTQSVTAAAYCVSCTTPPSAATAARTGS